MSELEKKFKEYLGIRAWEKSNLILAHDLAEIAAKHYVNCDECMKLCGENAELKKQLADIKYLSRKEVNSALWDYINDVCYENDDIVLKNPNHKCYEERICSLAIPKQKYLDRNELRNLIFKYPADEIDEKELFNDICKLALPTREKIFEILEKHSSACAIWYTSFPDIVSEILGGDNE